MLGDPHNFGQRVERKIVEGLPRRILYHKPRTTFWEFLFFSKTSPFASILSQFKFVDSTKSFASACMQLSVECHNPSFGISESIETSEYEGDKAELFGALLAYAYFFGIYDLHIDNIIPNKEGAQVVDCEIVFGKMLLPNEGLLLPFKNFGFHVAGVSRFGNVHEILNQKIFFSTYTSLLLFLDSQKENIVQSFESLNWNQHPIRILLRSTREYRNYLENPQETGHFLPEELEQLRRGDVPYFIRMPQEGDVYFYSTPHKLEKVKDLSAFKNTLSRLCQLNPADFIRSREVNTQLIIHSLLYLSRYQSLNTSYELSKDIKLSRDKDGAQLEFQGQTYSA